MSPELHGLLVFVGYGLGGSLLMSVALGILVKIWSWITPIDDWEELRKGNVAVAIVFAAIIIAFSQVIAAAVTPG
jgi:uncharacterized membrane protein YjfL (UPF0719 family)